MHQYNNYAYISSVPGGQNVAAYSARQSAAAASYNPFMSGVLAADDSRPQRDPLTADVSEADGRDFVPSSSCRRPMPGGVLTCLPRSSAELVPPPPTLPGARSAAERDRFIGGSALYSSPLERVAVHVDADENDGTASQQQHARSHSAPAVPRRHPGSDHQGIGPRSCVSPPPWFVMPTATCTGENKPDAKRRLLPSPVTSPSTPAPDNSTANVRYRRTFPLSDSELNGQVGGESRGVDVAIPTSTRRLNSVSLPAVSGSNGCCDPLLSRRRLRATRGRLNVYPASDHVFGSTLAGMAVVAGVALVISAVAVQLLLRLTAASRRSAEATSTVGAASTTTATSDSLLSKYGSDGMMTTGRVVHEVAVALAAVTVALDLCCLLTISMQCFFAVKLAACRNGEQSYGQRVTDGRSPTGDTETMKHVILTPLLKKPYFDASDLKNYRPVSNVFCFQGRRKNSRHGRTFPARMANYLKKCSACRTATSAGLFLSVPIFLLALTLYAVLEYTFTSGLTCVVVFTAAIVCITTMAAHSVHCWNIEKTKENSSTDSTLKSTSSVLPRDASKQTLNSDDSTVTQLKLSTLV